MAVSLPSVGTSCRARSVGLGHTYLTTATTELWDLATTSVAPGPSLDTPRSGHTATLLPDGRVLVVGGKDIGPHSSVPEVFASAEIVH